MIVVLDFETGKASIYNNEINGQSEDVEEFLEGLGHNMKNCEWMQTEKQRLQKRSEH